MTRSIHRSPSPSRALSLRTFILLGILRVRALLSGLGDLQRYGRVRSEIGFRVVEGVAGVFAVGGLEQVEVGAAERLRGIGSETEVTP